ncbi:DUF1349 domain-containing protein [Paenibacillus sp. CC-CFT742]|uniref:DUF1349 domain-containing protein n=1 Tax=Paenibacillus illinoisensis TaxID=59845 RepID=UPI00203FECF6|nr:MULTISPECIES: DUF1349 domain-containing protein [Paenibacillus]MCM3202884.1 DUF1349 domain-containing protein [Paenibacillus illinoisensis]WJH29767.1 DUF1349 domain-containing protein [Paenibacillus sp. CC-CFT742]
MSAAQFLGTSDAKWTTEPVATRTEGDRFIVEAQEGSDFWENTFYGFRHQNGHALLTPWDGNEAVEITFDLSSFTELYDQAGLMLWHSREQWIKAGVEVNDGVVHIGAVVTDHFSDWSLSPVPEWGGRKVTIRASYHNEAVVIRARTDEHPWRTIRVARFAYPANKQAGPFLCSPKRAGFEVAFTKWRTTTPDEDLHTDPPILD